MASDHQKQILQVVWGNVIRFDIVITQSFSWLQYLLHKPMLTAHELMNVYQTIFQSKLI